MEQMTTTRELRQRKFLLVLPLLTLPFLTMLFWALGGGTGNATAQTNDKTGFNTELPDANLEDAKDEDKMSYYDQAEKDSAKWLELLKNDPNYKGIDFSTDDTEAVEEGDTAALTGLSEADHALMQSPYGKKKYQDANEAKIYRKLADLDRAMNSATAPTHMQQGNNFSPYETSNNSGVTGADIDRLEQAMRSAQQSGSVSSAEPDPEINQLNGMLDKILDIQHPDRMQDKLKQESAAKKGNVFAVTATRRETPISLLENSSDTQPSAQNRFYALADQPSGSTEQNAIQATIYQTQTITNGSTVKLRLAGDIYINGTMIPKNSFVFGQARLEGERLGITINSIRYESSLFSVQLAVYDMDGVNGIYIPGAITRDVSKESADRAIQSLSIASLDPSVGAQAASAAATAGVETVKSLLSKKVKLIKVTVKAGYQVLLRDEKQKD